MFQWFKDLFNLEKNRMKLAGYRHANKSLLEGTPLSSINHSVLEKLIEPEAPIDPRAKLPGFEEGMCEAIEDWRELRGLEGEIDDPLFEVLFTHMKRWNVNSDGEGYQGINGSHVTAILNVLGKAIDQLSTEELLTSPGKLSRLLGKRIQEGQKQYEKEG